MDLAIIRFGGKQFVIKDSETFKVTRVKEGVKPEVLLWQEGEKIEVGTPVLTGHTIKIEKIEDKLDKKINVSRFKAKVRHRRHKGFRQPISVVKVKEG